MTSEAPIRLRLPAQDLEQMSVFTTREDSAREWAAQLPVANPEVVAEQMSEALDQICTHAEDAVRRGNRLPWELQWFTPSTVYRSTRP